jgi:hypothetical protein
MNASSKYGEAAAFFWNMNPIVKSGQARDNRPSPVKRLLSGASKNGPSGGSQIAMTTKHIVAMTTARPFISNIIFLENPRRDFSWVSFCSSISTSTSKRTVTSQR